MNNTSTRKSYGLAITELGKVNDKIFLLDAETSNSTFADIFKKEFPDRFIESFIAEQNMVSMSTGLSKMGKIPFVSTFAAFFSRGFDQIRMAGYSGCKINFIGSHCGVSIGQDGTSQMGLEDIAIFRSVFDSTVVYPSDYVSTLKLLTEMSNREGVNYMRTTRADTQQIYSKDEEFYIGGSKTVKESKEDRITVIGCGITLFEALKAYEYFYQNDINLRIIDLYSIKPLDKDCIVKACQETDALIIVEDHYLEGGVYEAICGSGVVSKPIYSLAVKKMPRSGRPEELIAYEQIGTQSIISLIKDLTKSQA